jgi:hypothetical protein
MERLTGKQAQSLMEAVASVYEKKEDCVKKEKKGDHNCAKKVCHEEYGQGECIFGQHAVPDENGFVSHYDVQFEHGIVENVSVEDLEILEAHSHPTAEGHRYYEGEDLQEVDLKKLYDGVVGAGKAVGGVVKKVLEPADNSPEAQDARMGKRRPQNAQQQGVANKTAEVMKNSADLFDIVKGHLIDEGLTEEEALKKMLTLTDEERSEIIEGSCGSKKDKKKKGGYGK